MSRLLLTGLGAIMLVFATILYLSLIEPLDLSGLSPTVASIISEIMPAGFVIGGLIFLISGMRSRHPDSDQWRG